MTDPLFKFLLRTLPTSLAVQVVRTVAARTQRPAIHSDQRAAMWEAQQLRYGADGVNVAWSWGQGPLVVLIHGWNGRAAQMAPLALHLARHGFRAVCIDITGHGDSHGNITSWRCFIDDLHALVAMLDAPIFAMIGHSAGGLAMMAARHIKRMQAQRYVCICSPSHPFPPIRRVCERLNPPERVVEAYKEFIAHQFDTTWNTLASGHAFRELRGDLLLFYDERDKFIDHREGDRILGWCPGAHLSKTSSYGHTRVLSAPELHAMVSEFLSGAQRREPRQAAAR